MSRLSDLPKVCVVTPVYNTSEHLAACIESVVQQDYPNWHYLIVNNCSTDASRDIAARYAEADPRIELLDNARFLDQVDNYNHAIRLAAERGEFCKVVQADDWIFPSCLREMVRVVRGHPNVGLISSYRLRGTRVTGDGLPVEVEQFSGSDICRRQLLSGGFHFGSPTTVMYRSSTIRRQAEFYNKTALHEDTDACYRILSEHDFAFVHQVLSFSRVDEASISGRVSQWNPQSLDKLLVVKTHGPTVLGDEFDGVWARTRRRYFRELARRLLLQPERDHFLYHRKGLASAGIDILCLDLFRALVWEGLDLLLNPKKTVGELIHTLRGRGRRKQSASGGD